MLFRSGVKRPRHRSIPGPAGLGTALRMQHRAHSVLHARFRVRTYARGVFGSSLRRSLAFGCSWMPRLLPDSSLLSPAVSIPGSQLRAGPAEHLQPCQHQHPAAAGGAPPDQRQAVVLGLQVSCHLPVGGSCRRRLKQQSVFLICSTQMLQKQKQPRKLWVWESAWTCTVCVDGALPSFISFSLLVHMLLRIGKLHVP